MRSLYVRRWSRSQPTEVVRRQWLEAMPAEHRRAAAAWREELEERLDVNLGRRITISNSALAGAVGMFIGGALMGAYGRHVADKTAKRARVAK